MSEPTTLAKSVAHIRWMIRRDMPEVLDIENESFEFPWVEDDFIRCLRQLNCIGMVAEREDRVVGYMFYELYENRIHMLNIAVSRDYRRRDVASQMIDKLIAKLSPNRRNHIVLEVRDTNFESQIFFRDIGFRAIGILRSHYEHTEDDSYQMTYSHGGRHG